MQNSHTQKGFVYVNYVNFIDNIKVIIDWLENKCLFLYLRICVLSNTIKGHNCSLEKKNSANYMKWTESFFRVGTVSLIGWWRFGGRTQNGTSHPDLWNFLTLLILEHATEQADNEFDRRWRKRGRASRRGNEGTQANLGSRTACRCRLDLLLGPVCAASPNTA